MKSPALLVAMLLIGCGPAPRGSDDTGDDDNGHGGDGAMCQDVIDVVFVLDTSSSMEFVLTQLEMQIAQVVTASNTLSGNAHFGLIVFQDNHRLDTTGPLEGGKVHVLAGSLQTAFRNYRENFTDANRNPGDGPSGRILQNPICEENSLDALYAAATEYPWRTNATRVVILATDDTFLERPDNYGDRDGDGDTTDTNFPSEGNYPAMRSLPETLAKLRDGRIRVFSFSRLAPPASIFERCDTGRRLPWAAISNGWTTPYGTEAPIPMQTDAKNFDLDQVKNGSLSLVATINSVVLDSFCSPPIL
jgi:hypothetical protein